MIAALIVYAVAVSLVLALAGLLLEWLAAASQWPRRWVWAGLLSASVAVGFGVPLSLQAPAPVVTPVVASGVLTRSDIDSGGSPIRISVERVPLEAVPNPPPRRIAPAATLRDAVVRLDSIARALWPSACAAVLVIYLAGHLTLALRRRQWPARDINGVRVLVSRDIGPAVIGVLRPQIVLPEWTLDADCRALAFMLRHEQEHQRARDPLLIQIARVVALVMPWNPAVWWMLSRLKLAIECDCDGRVLAGAADAARVDYGEVLLSVGTHRSARHAFLGPAMLERSSTLARRIVAMQRARLRFLPVRLAAAGATAVVILAAIFLLPAPRLRAAAMSTPTAAPVPRRDVALASDRVRSDVPSPVVPSRDAGSTQTPRPIAGAQPVTIQLRDVMLSDALLTLGSAAGVDIRIASGVDFAGPINARFTNARFEDALNVILNVAKLRYEVIGEKTVLVSPATPQTPDPSLGEVYKPGNGVSWPTLIRQVEPQYTSEAMRAKIQGTVYLTGVVQPNGVVDDIKVARSLNRTYGLDQAAIDAARKWLFSPCRKTGHPVPCGIQLELEFRPDWSPSADAPAGSQTTPAPAPSDVVYEPGNGVTWPTLVNQVEPQYTEAARKERIQGTVHVSAVVTTNGTTRLVQVTKSLDTVYGLDQAAIEAVQRWLFKPCAKDGKLVACRVAIDLDFRLRPSPSVDASAGQATPEVIYQPGSGVTWPTLLRQVEPKYTDAARAAKIQGTVYLSGVVETDGTTGRLKIQKSLDTVHGLDQAAMDAAKQWLFKPCTKDSKPVPCSIQLELDFRLERRSDELAARGDFSSIVDEFSMAAKDAYRSSDVEGMRVITRVEPKYTSEAMRQKLEGQVFVEVLVGTDGSVSHARVVQSLDKVYGLDASALDAAKQMRWTPGTVAGRPVLVRTVVTLSFRLH